jgi:hypothetical protein
MELPTFHHVVDVLLSPRYMPTVRARLDAWGTPFPLSVSATLERVLRQGGDELEDSWARHLAEPGQRGRAPGAPGCWTLDLENRELYPVLRAAGRLGCDLDEAIALGCRLSLEHELPTPARSPAAGRQAGLGALVVLLDLDGTLLVDPNTYRPGAMEFVAALTEHSTVGLWSASSAGRVWREAMRLADAGLCTAHVLTLEDTFGPTPYTAAGKCDTGDGTFGFRKPMGDLVCHGLDPARTLLVDDGAEHWSGQHNNLVCVPTASRLRQAEGALVLKAVRSHIEAVKTLEDVRLAYGFEWEEGWGQGQGRVAHLHQRRRVVV